MKMKAMIPKELILKAMKVVSDQNVGQGISFDIAGTDHLGFLKLEKSYSPDRAICLKTAVVQNGDDHLVQHFFHYAENMEEMKNWLLEPCHVDEIIESLQQLSARVDQGFD